MTATSGPHQRLAGLLVASACLLLASADVRQLANEGQDSEADDSAAHLSYSNGTGEVDGASRAKGGDVSPGWRPLPNGRPIPKPDILVAPFSVLLFSVSGKLIGYDTRVVGNAIRVNGDYMLASMISMTSVNEGLAKQGAPQKDNGAFRFKLGLKENFDAQNDQGWQFQAKWKKRLWDNIALYKFEVREGLDEKKSVGEMYPMREWAQFSTSTDYSKDKCYVLIYAGDGSVRERVSINVAKFDCEEKYCLIDLGGGELCGQADLGAPIVCNGIVTHIISDIQTCGEKKHFAVKLAYFNKLLSDPTSR